MLYFVFSKGNGRFSKSTAHLHFVWYYLTKTTEVLNRCVEITEKQIPFLRLETETSGYDDKWLATEGNILSQLATPHHHKK